jgi:NAD(P)H-hydrate epimerase
MFDATSYSEAICDIEGAELIIDSMLGTGATGEPRPPLATWIEAANKSSAAKVAIDIPTGIDADTGAACSTFFITDATLTFVALKPAMMGLQSKKLFGEIAVLPIGIPEQLIHEILSKAN